MIVWEWISAILFGTLVVSIFYLESRLWLSAAIRKFRKSPDWKKPLTGKMAMMVHCLAAVGLLCVLYGYFVEPYWIEVNTYSIPTVKLHNARFRIVHISDLHCDDKPRAEHQLVQLINAAKPDIVVFTGDAINEQAALELFRKTMRDIEAPLGKFAVTGNNDVVYWRTLNLYKQTGFHLLNTGVETITKDGESIGIGGLDYEQGEHSWQTIGKFQPDTFNLFLYHNADMLEYYPNPPYDLYLSGHTHGGQVALPFYGALLTLSRHGKKYEAGLYDVGGHHLFVNRGIGMEGGFAPRVRFCARPQIAVFDIIPAQEARK